ncbi:N-acetylhexosamine 1-kinase [Methylomarinovum caldicuralii]|uniref:N-acetylhexosamine 1-kinase n=1 Tax=Methylomarinovum caldicuralii TaxID=438856 RepID=A0AAU9CLX9_9GAMM|nr:phosphotransferase [Methylomarinovum caldicuralii]BCX80858.1 N-acetylhexosamine 1-kinase [Methylomarinovum caldicuralii]
MTDPAAVAARFALPGRVVAVEPLGRGLINDTWRLVTTEARGVLQRLNGAVFPRPDRIMANLRIVSRHLAAAPIRLPQPIPPVDGGDLVVADGHAWRLLEHLPGITLTALRDLHDAAALGRSLGKLHRGLADLDPGRLHDTLPGFHEMAHYLSQFDRQLTDGPVDAETASLIEFIEARRARALALEETGSPRRVIHGDPKLDNVLFDPRSRTPLAWIDPDTLKPGLWLWDVGDCVRSACGAGGRFRLERALALLGSWWREVRPVLTRAERDWVPEAVWRLPFELGVRFLIDHLAGDRYFKVNYRGENLERARGQFALTAAIERQGGELAREWRRLSAAPGR